MKELYPRIGELAVAHFDEFEASLEAFKISIGNPIETEGVAAGEQNRDENRLAANIVSAMSKMRVQ